MIEVFGALSADRPLEADLCIVGSGAAGLALAAQFLNSPARVIVLESGLHQSDALGEDLNALECVGLRHDGGRDGRIRSFGGTTLAWGGQLLPLRESELAERAWVPHSGWPLTLAELEPYYRRVEMMLGIDGPPYDRGVWARLGMIPPALDEREWGVRFSQWAALGRRNFALRWWRELARSRNLRVLLDATAVAVRCTPAEDRCQGIEIRSRSGRSALVRAQAFVLACGGIETARLLLASPSRDGNGIANRNGLVGRFFQDHISYFAGEVQPTERRVVRHWFDPRYIGATLYSVKMEPTDAVMQREAWLNVMGHIAFQVPEALGWLEVRRILRSVQAGRLELPSFSEGIAMARGSVELTRLAFSRWVSKRRRSPGAARVLLMVDVEQAPNPESRVSLDTRTDPLGMPRVRLDWRVGDLERRTLAGFTRKLAADLERLGIGRIRLAAAPDFESRDSLGSARDIFHHMGTTRMSATPRNGVVRSDLRCHGIANLYIAGPSVFPTSGIANPTFTALALALRLSDHLQSTLKSALPDATASKANPTETLPTSA
jgi:choline dehydrogenase-like flavoprotein